MIYAADDTTLIFSAIQSIILGNNGYATLRDFPERLIPALEAAGFVVIASKDAHGNAVLKGFTVDAQAALKASPFGASTYKAVSIKADAPDYEAAILARNDEHLFA